MIKTLLRKSKKILAIIQSRKIKNRMPSYRRNPTKTTIPRGYMWKKPPMKVKMSLKLFVRKTNWNKVILKNLKMEPTKLVNLPETILFGPEGGSVQELLCTSPF